MAHTLPPLPYALDALAPHLSKETLDFHYNKHHASYVAKLNTLMANNAELKALSIDDIVKKGPGAVPTGVYNCAAQSWNHTFYWKSMSPKSKESPNLPSSKLNELIIKSFGSYDAFKARFSEIAAGHFGSGWAWLVQDKRSGLLKVAETHDAISMMSDATVVPILTCDVWEHAYYIDYRNARPEYIKSWWKLVNWDFAEHQVQWSQLGKL